MSTIPKKLTHDKNFIPCPEADGDEFYPNGIFVFNITKIEDHIDGVDVSKPIIMAEISPGN